MSEAVTQLSDHESRIVRLEQIADDTRRSLDRLDQRMDRMEQRVDGLDARLRDVEQSLAELGAKIDLLVSQVIAKLPSWWQMPAVIGATVLLLAPLYSGFRYLQAHGLF